MYGISLHGLSAVIESVSSFGRKSICFQIFLNVRFNIITTVNVIIIIVIIIIYSKITAI